MVLWLKLVKFLPCLYGLRLVSWELFVWNLTSMVWLRLSYLFPFLLVLCWGGFFIFSSYNVRELFYSPKGCNISKMCLLCCASHCWTFALYNWIFHVIEGYKDDFGWTIIIYLRVFQKRKEIHTQKWLIKKIVPIRERKTLLSSCMRRRIPFSLTQPKR